MALPSSTAAGYVGAEFRMFGKSLDDRAWLMDEGLEVVTRALAGERFIWRDREIFVRPLPRSRPPTILVGGGVAPAARRAAKYGLGLWALQPEMTPAGQKLIAVYQAECRAEDRLGDAGALRRRGPAEAAGLS